jgi:hypothetical protein
VEKIENSKNKIVYKHYGVDIGNADLDNYRVEMVFEPIAYHYKSDGDGVIKIIDEARLLYFNLIPRYPEEKYD